MNPEDPVTGRDVVGQRARPLTCWIDPAKIELKPAELVELTGPMQAHPAVRIESNRTEDPPMDGHLPTQIRQCCLGNVVRYSAAGVERAHVVCCCDEREKVDQTRRAARQNACCRWLLSLGWCPVGSMQEHAELRREPIGLLADCLGTGGIVQDRSGH